MTILLLLAAYCCSDYRYPALGVFNIRIFWGLTENENEEATPGAPSRVVSTGGSHRELKASDGVVSYLQICQAVKAQHMFPRDYQFTEIFEDQETCSENTRTSTALSRIFISSYIAYQAKIVGFDLSYRHGCEMNHGIGLIQEVLPSQIEIQKDLIEPISREGMVSLCEKLDFDFKIDLLRTVIPIMRLNFRKVVDSILLQIDASGNSPRHGILNIKKDNYDNPDTAVIFIPCRDKHCTDVWVVPYYSFLEYLPSSVKFVDIVMTTACDSAVQTCREYVIDIADTLEKFDPKRTVNIMIADPSSIELMTRLMVADYVLCGAGWGKQCLVPALARDPSRRGKIVVWESKQSSKEEQSTESMLLIAMLEKIGAPDVLVRVSSPMEKFPIMSLSEISVDTGMAKEFLRSVPPPNSGICRFLRGKVGNWVQDFECAGQTAYGVELLHHSGAAERIFRQRVANGETGNKQFRPSTTYKWEETFYRGSCDIPIVTKKGMCSVLSAMEIRRILFLGDSLSLQQALSLWMLLRPSEDLPLQNQSGFRYIIDCPNPNGFNFTLQFIRNDELLETSEPVSIAEQTMNCKNYCYPWIAPYMGDDRRTLLVVNAGAHLHDRALFEGGMRRFVQIFDSLNRVGDIVMIRTLVPGHKNCGRPGLKPFNSFAEYVADTTKEKTKDTYNWVLFSSYNDFIGRLMDERILEQKSLARMEILDVFPMTVRRPDGHMADEYKSPDTKRNDCLHYSLPGPIDWWNHLMLGNLMDIHTIDMQGRSIGDTS